eukprot:gene13631-15054_t
MIADVSPINYLMRTARLIVNIEDSIGNVLPIDAYEKKCSDETASVTEDMFPVSIRLEQSNHNVSFEDDDANDDDYEYESDEDDVESDESNVEDITDEIDSNDLESNYDYDDEYDIYEDGFITGEEELRRYQEHMEQLDNNE